MIKRHYIYTITMNWDHPRKSRHMAFLDRKRLYLDPTFYCCDFKNLDITLSTAVASQTRGTFENTIPWKFYQASRRWASSQFYEQPHKPINFNSLLLAPLFWPIPLPQSNGCYLRPCKIVCQHDIATLLIWSLPPISPALSLRCLKKLWGNNLLSFWSCT